MMSHGTVHRRRRLEEIARRVLDIPTLRTRGRDGKDFHDLAVWRIEEALEEAYIAGANSRACCPKCGTTRKEYPYHLEPKTLFVCPNCGQWAREYAGKVDCLNRCAARGFAPREGVKQHGSS
jgi:transposase